jgi:hypothetical protein
VSGGGSTRDARVVCERREPVRRVVDQSLEADPELGPMYDRVRLGLRIVPDDQVDQVVERLAVGGWVRVGDKWLRLVKRGGS